MRRFTDFLSSEIGRIAVSIPIFACALILDALSFEIFAIVLYCVTLIFCGFSVFADAIRGILRRDLLDEKFLMSISSIGAMIIGEYAEGVAVMLFFLVGEYAEHRAVYNSRKRIKALMDICPDEATVIRGGIEVEVDAEEVEVGETVIVRAGQRIPVDATVISGFADVDTSALTGESLPVSVNVGCEVSGGAVVLNGVITCEAIRASEVSAASRILSLVEDASEHKAPEESFITSFSHYYTPIVVILAIIMALFPPIFGIMLWRESVYRALTFLVVSCPCALVISVPMAFFGGIGRAASSGILFKGGDKFASIANVKTVAFDKTGTLTTGKLTVKDVISIGVERDKLLAYAASVESGSIHPIAEAIRSSVDNPPVAVDYTELAGKGSVAYVEGERIAVGNAALMQAEGIDKELLSQYEGASVYVSRTGALIGAITLLDSIRDEAEEAINALKRLGVKRTVMLSGDKREKAEAVGGKLALDEVYAELLPEEKYSRLEELIKAGKTMYVGDGINDAPSLALADAGVAMGGIGSDSAIESADLVITSDNLSRLPFAIKLARQVLRIAKENIIFAIGIKALVLILSAFGFANMWLAVFADVGVAVLAILNSMRTLIGKER